jgi:hypothetical protein
VPAARDVGEVLFLVLGQQDETERVGAALDPRRGAVELQEVRPEGLLGVDALQRQGLGAQEERRMSRQRPRLESMGERASSLTHGSPVMERGRRDP